MDDSLVTVDKVLAWVEEKVQTKQPIDMNTWMYVAERINVLIQTEQEKLFSMEQGIAKMKKILIEDGKTVAYAKIIIEATDEYKDMRIQKAKIDRALELIKISKQHSRLSSDLMRSQM